MTIRASEEALEGRMNSLEGLSERGGSSNFEAAVFASVDLELARVGFADLVLAIVGVELNG